MLLDGDVVDPSPLCYPSGSPPVNHMMARLDIDNYQSCVRQLQNGISGMKYNWANADEKRVLINLS